MADSPTQIERTAQLIAHRACLGVEHDPANGKLHGLCVVCGVPWPCEYAGKPPPSKQEALKGAAPLPLYILLHDPDRTMRSQPNHPERWTTIRGEAVEWLNPQPQGKLGLVESHAVMAVSHGGVCTLTSVPANLP